jgi:mono/diheme cytochrome c family protein
MVDVPSNFLWQERKSMKTRIWSRFTTLALGTGVMVLTFTFTLSAQTNETKEQPDSHELYKTKCAMCHAADGSGNTPVGKKLGVRDLRSAEVQKQSDAELATIVAKGKNKMPAFANKLSEEQIHGLIACIRQLAKKP